MRPDTIAKPENQMRGTVRDSQVNFDTDKPDKVEAKDLSRMDDDNYQSSTMLIHNNFAADVQKGSLSLLNGNSEIDQKNALKN